MPVAGATHETNIVPSILSVVPAVLHCAIQMDLESPHCRSRTVPIHEIMYSGKSER